MSASPESAWLSAQRTDRCAHEVHSRPTLLLRIEVIKQRTQRLRIELRAAPVATTKHHTPQNDLPELEPKQGHFELLMIPICWTPGLRTCTVRGQPRPVMRRPGL